MKQLKILFSCIGFIMLLVTASLSQGTPEVEPSSKPVEKKGHESPIVTSDFDVMLLPPELWNHIFESLPSPLDVSKVSLGCSFLHAMSQPRKEKLLQEYLSKGVTSSKLSKVIVNPKERLTRIKHIKLIHTRKDPVNDGTLKTLACSFPRLTSVDLSKCGEFTIEGIRCLITGCGKFSEGHLDGCTEAVDGGTEDVGNNGSNITSLRISECHQITKETIELIFSNCNMLASLVMDHCGNEKLKDLSLSKNLEALTELNMDFCNKVPAKDIGAMVQKCPNLTRLIVSNTQFEDFSTLEGHTQLLELNLSFCRQIKDLSALPEMDNLTTLSLKSCPEAFNFSAIGRFKNLTTLHLDYTSVTEQDIEYITKNCEKLEVLTLKGCSQIKNIEKYSNFSLSDPSC